MLNEDRANKINQIWSHVGGKDKINLSSKNCIVQKAQAHTHTHTKTETQTANKHELLK